MRKELQNRVAELELHRPVRDRGLDDLGPHARWRLRRGLDGLRPAEELDALYGPLDDSPEPPPDVVLEHQKISPAARRMLERNLEAMREAVAALPPPTLTEREKRR